MLIISIRLLLFQVAEILLLEAPPDAKMERANACFTKTGQKCNSPPPKPKWAWQVTRKHAALSAHDHVMSNGLTRSSLQHPNTPSPKVASGGSGSFAHDHAFQQQLIEDQRRQLQKQQELILELQRNQSLKGQEDAGEDTTICRAFGNPAPRTGKQLRENQPDYMDTRPSRYSANNNNTISLIAV